MANALRIIGWDILQQRRNHFYAATFVTTLFFCLAVVLLSRFDLSAKWLSILLYTDPAVIGLSFVGAFLLSEKGGNTLSALSVSPMRAHEYLFGKLVSFSLLGIISGFVIALVAAAPKIDWAWMALALLMTNSLAVLIGFAAAATVPSVNAFLVRMSLVMLVSVLPVLSFMGFVDHALGNAFMVIPSYSALVLLSKGFGGEMGAVFWHMGYIAIWVVLMWGFGIRQYNISIQLDRRS